MGLAETQSGMFTAAQAQQTGARRPQLADLANRGVIERIQHGVYLLSGAPVDAWMQLRGAWLALAPERTAVDRLTDNPEGVVSHRSAAVLLGLGDVDGDRLEITIDVRRRTRNPDVLIHRGTLERGDWTTREGLPVTTALKTTATLADSGLDAGHLATIARDAVLRHDVALTDLAEALGPAAHRYGHRDGTQLRDTLLQEAGIPTSVVDIAATAASDHVIKALAGTPQVTELARQLGEQLTASPAYQQMLRDLATHAIATPATQQVLAHALEPLQRQIAQAMEPITTAWREQLAKAMPAITVTTRALAQAQQAARSAAASSVIAPELREQLRRAAPPGRTADATETAQ